VSDSLDPIRAGSSLIYTIDVRNGGPSTATGVTFIDTLPAGVTFTNYAETRGGVCAHVGGILTCNLNSLKSGFVWTIYIYVTVNATTSGTITNSTATGAAGADLNPRNDQASVSTTVTPLPSVRFSAASYSVNEGAGVKTITVQLSTASDQSVTVHYATGNGSATAPGDYTATSGDLTFNPGQPSTTFNVPIVNDNLDEPNETINLVLSAPNGATLGTPPSATLTIQDNDTAPAPSWFIHLPLVRR
jgi:uncharacterized repeat protein (TIGR01451 family)